MEAGTTSQPRDAIVLRETKYLQPMGRFVLPEFTSGSQTYAATGRWLFFNPSGTSAYVIMQAALTSGLLLDHAIATVQLTAPQTPCAVTLSKNNISSPGTGMEALPASMESPGRPTPQPNNRRR